MKNKEQNESDQKRTSRKLLANADLVPRYLQELWPVPTGITVYHTVHVDCTLPLFQARLATGSYDGKRPESIGILFTICILQLLIQEIIYVNICL